MLPALFIDNAFPLRIKEEKFTLPRWSLCRHGLSGIVFMYA
jgi:hypothetical protein